MGAVQSTSCMPLGLMSTVESVKWTDLCYFRDWSLITGRGGLQNGRGGGGQEKFYFKKRGGGSYSHAKGEGTTSFGVVLTWEREVLAILMGGGLQNVSILLKGGMNKFTLSWGNTNTFGPVCAPSPPPCN